MLLYFRISLSLSPALLAQPPFLFLFLSYLGRCVGSNDSSNRRCFPANEFCASSYTKASMVGPAVGQ